VNKLLILCLMVILASCGDRTSDNPMPEMPEYNRENPNEVAEINIIKEFVLTRENKRLDIDIDGDLESDFIPFILEQEGVYSRAYSAMEDSKQWYLTISCYQERCRAPAKVNVIENSENIAFEEFVNIDQSEIIPSDNQYLWNEIFDEYRSGITFYEFQFTKTGPSFKGQFMSIEKLDSFGRYINLVFRIKDYEKDQYGPSRIVIEYIVKETKI
jgi:hypothetical protein